MLTIGKLAKATDASVDTIRYYERMGLMSPDARSAHDYRMYDESAVNRLRFIKNAQYLGFSLAEIEQLLAFGTSKESAAADVLRLAEEKIQTHENKINEIKKIETVLVRLAKQCAENGPSSECPILKYFYDNTDKRL